MPIDGSLFDQTTGGITVILPESASNAALVIQGVRPEALVTVTPEPTQVGVPQVDVEFLKVTSAENAKTFDMLIRLSNRGSQPLTLTDKDIVVLPPGGMRISPFDSTPALPQEIPAGGSLEIQVTFPRARAPSVVLEIFGSTLEYYLP